VDKKKKTYKDFVLNNPRADRERKDSQDIQADKEIEDKMLYGEKSRAPKKSSASKRMDNAYRNIQKDKKLDRIKDRDLWPGFESAIADP